MTLERARAILGSVAEKWDDETLLVQIEVLRSVARIAAQEAIKQFNITRYNTSHESSHLFKDLE